MNELQPVNQNVLLEITGVEQERKTQSGIIIPDSAIINQRIGKVIAISNIENPEIAVGDNVLYKDGSGTETEFDEKKYLLIQYSDLLAKVVETEKI